MAGQADKPFWKVKALSEMTEEEWESLCDGCAKCCLHKLEDPDTGAIDHTNVACSLLDTESCRCINYAARQILIPDCVKVDSDNVAALKWMPMSCAYRLLSEGKDLPEWHPLVSGDPESVHWAYASVRGRAVCETEAGPLEHHVVDWPDYVG